MPAVPTDEIHGEAPIRGCDVVHSGNRLGQQACPQAAVIALSTSDPAGGGGKTPGIVGLPGLIAKD